MRFRPGWLLLLALLVVIGVRTTLAARGTLAPGGTPKGTHAAAGLDPLLVSNAHQDSLLKGVVGNSRDPFRPWTAVAGGSVATGAPRPVVEVPVVPPRVVVFMQDGSSTMIQLEVDGETSPRLGVGGTFLGWTITGLTPDGVAVAKDGRSFTLRRP